ncbi:MAG: NAD(P)-dependent oxidoreductase [Chloroflexi bacterium]|nr:NAD(P)-dependent oxidoreductase [Chloroflexota bacterium]
MLGTGRMGSAMARALAHGGTDLVLHNRTPERAEELANELGASVAGSAAEAAAAADVAITMLADGTAVGSTWGGSDGLVAGARNGSVLVDMSTVPPETLRRFEQPVRERGAGILDAPVSGSVSLAESGRLTIMAGGEAADLERARSVLEMLAGRIFHVGPLGSGHALKLAVNAVIFSLNNGVSEALVLAERAGIDRTLAYDVLASSAAGAPYLDYKRESFVSPDEAPLGFSLDLAAKDLRLITEMADGLGVAMPQAHANQALIAEASAHLGADRDFSAVASHLRELTKEGALG